MNIYFFVSVAILAILLFFPVRKLVWVFSVRRLERKENRTLSKTELQGQLNRARVLAVAIALVFSYLFNLSLGTKLGYG